MLVENEEIELLLLDTKQTEAIELLVLYDEIVYMYVEIIRYIALLTTVHLFHRLRENI